MPKEMIFANANDEGFGFLFYDSELETQKSGLFRYKDQGHFVTIVGKGGTGKSILAMQIIAGLLDESTKDSDSENIKVPAAFYFSLESSLVELQQMITQFRWGVDRYESQAKTSQHIADRWSCNGLNIFTVPSPADDMSGIIFQIRQTISEDLSNFGELVALVIDPLGGVNLSKDLRGDLAQLKELADGHRTFLFLLVEENIYEQFPIIEHYSQSVIHLMHDPQSQPSRTLYIQKSRNQAFRTGFHQFDIVPKVGFKVYPSVQAQSAFAHENVQSDLDPPSPEKNDTSSLLLGADVGGKEFSQVTPGSVVFLMGPPGTFKQFIATSFSAAGTNNSLYISFKAELDSVQKSMGDRRTVIPINGSNQESINGSPKTYFLDARNPLLTPEEVLTTVRIAITSTSGGLKFDRAVIWGLRRLNDMPNFLGSKAIQFLEALVTLLKSENIISFLVDWPDIEKANTLPIVDLSQSILLTRVCKGRIELNELQEIEELLWGGEEEHLAHVALLRIQRDAQGFHRDFGFRFSKKDQIISANLIDRTKFEKCWVLAGKEWEKDPGLG